MSSSFTMFGRSQMLRSMVTPDLFVPIDSFEIALTNTVPPANASEAQLVEPTAAAYVRQTYSTGSTYWAPSGFGEFYNTLLVTWPQVTVDSWGLIRGYAVVDPVSGQCVSVGSIQNPFQATVGYVPKLEPGSVMLGIYD